MIIEYRESNRDSDTVTVRRNEKVIGKISRSRGSFTASKDARLGTFELDSIARFMASRLK